MERTNLLLAGDAEIAEPRSLTAADVRRRFSAFVPGPDRGGGRGDHDLNPGMVPLGEPRAAAVLVPLVDRPAGLTILLTQRTAHLRRHAGQIAFPGGRIEEFDANPIDAALRETQEEIGLGRDRVEPVGHLDRYVTRTGFTITPVVGIVSPPFALTLDVDEVADAFEVPLAFILNPINRQRQSLEYQGIQRHFYVFPYLERNIWGATAGMLVNLAEVLA